MKQFKPTVYIQSIDDMPVAFLKEKGIKGLILDIDNTLVPPHTPVCDAHAADFAKRMEKDFKLCIVSNNIYERAKKFADSFPMDFVCDGNKPAKKPFLLALGKLKLKPSEVAVVGDQVFTDVWGANRMGMLSVLVDPICDKEGFFVRFKRVLERLVYKRQ